MRKEEGEGGWCHGCDSACVCGRGGGGGVNVQALEVPWTDNTQLTAGDPPVNQQIGVWGGEVEGGEYWGRTVSWFW